MRYDQDKFRGCWYYPDTVHCNIPYAHRDIPPECRRCGWHPTESKRRRAEIAETGRCTVRRVGQMGGGEKNV